MERVRARHQGPGEKVSVDEGTVVKGVKGCGDDRRRVGGGERAHSPDGVVLMRLLKTRPSNDLCKSPGVD